MRSSWVLKAVKIIFALAFTFSAVSWAQQSYMDEPGIPAFTTAFPVENGFINLANGNLHIEIPIASYPQRGNIKALNARLVYDSRFWTFDPNGDDPIGVRGWQPNGVTGYPQPFGVGWRFITGGEIGSINDTFTAKQCACLRVDDTGACLQWAYSTTYTGFSVQLSDGTNHRAPKSYKLQTSCGGSTVSGSVFAQDNSGYEFVISDQAHVKVFAPDGTQVAPVVQDTNGNFFTETYEQVPGVGYIRHVIDTVGREPVIVSFSGNPVTQVFLDYLNPQGTRSRATVNLTPLNLATQFGTGLITQERCQAFKAYLCPMEALTSFNMIHMDKSPA